MNLQAGFAVHLAARGSGRPGGRSIPRGQLYVTAPVLFGRLHVLPTIGRLLAEHEALSARMMLLDRNVRIVEEGIDVAVRIGSVQQTIVASPAYLAAHGVPTILAELAQHHCIAGSGVRVGSAWSFDGAGGSAVEIVSRLTINTIDGALAAAEPGLRRANVLSYQSAEAIASGRLVRVLAEHAPPPMPVSLLYDSGRAAMPAVRVFIEAMREQAREAVWG